MTDGGNHFGLVDMFRHRELDQYAVHSLVGVKAGDEVEQFLLGSRLGQPDGGAFEAHLFGILSFRFDV